MTVAERAQTQVPLEGVVEVEAEVEALLGCLHHGRVFEAIAQPEGAVVVEIVADVHIGGRSLRANGLDGRVRIDHGLGGQPAVVGNAVEAGPPVVAGHVLEQPSDGIVGVRGFVDRLRVAVLAGRALHDECAFGSEPAADVLKDEDVAVGHKLAVGLAHQGLGELGDAVGRSLDQERQRAGRGLRLEDDRVELHAVAHGDHHLGHGEGRVRAGLGLAGEGPATAAAAAASKSARMTFPGCQVRSHGSSFVAR